MDHVVHINNGSTEIRPLVLRLLPGEETIFNLKVVNHGDPSNISLQASSPVFKAVRLRKPNHYVVLEETIPVMARMPVDRKRLDGEILLSGGGGESRVPITLLRDCEDPGDDLEDPSLSGDGEYGDDFMGEEPLRAHRDYHGDDEENSDIDRSPKKRRGRFEEDSEPDGDEDAGNEEAVEEGDDGDLDDDSESLRCRRRSGDVGEEDEEKEPQRISFSRDRDLKSYRSAAHQKRRAAEGGKDLRSPGQPSSSRRGADRTDKGGNERSGPGEAGIVGRAGDDDIAIIPRYSTRIDDSFVDPRNEQARSYPPAGPKEQDVEQGGWPEESPDESQKPSSAYEEDYHGYRQEADSESREIIHQAEKKEITPEDPRVYGAGDEYHELDGGSPSIGFTDRWEGFAGLGSLKIVPATIFLALVIVLILTFITESIPEFAGALGSSILIVTLIIYGAATLLKT
jgi:hypothetical protein